MAGFTSSLVNQLCTDLKRVQKLGVRKIGILLMMPMGCLPQLSKPNSYQKCVRTANILSYNHNQLLLRSLANMNSELGKPVFVALDIYNAFLSIIHSMQKRRAGESSI